MKRKLLFLALLMFVISTMSIAQTTYYVNGTSGTDDTATGRGTAPDAAWKTIQWAINHVVPNVTINVAAGTYIENVSVNKTITLIGAGASTTIIVATNANSTPLTFSSTGSTVGGFTLTHNYTAGELSAWAFNNNGVTFSGLANVGNTLTQCIITLNRNGIYFNSSVNNTVSNNLITNNRTGINMCGTLNNTVIAGNTISDNWTEGIVSYANANLTDYSTITVTGNTFSNNWYTEVLIKDASTYSGTLDVTNNSFTDSPVTYSTSSNSTLNEPRFEDQKPTFLGGSSSKPSTELPTLRIYNSGPVRLTYNNLKTIFVEAGQSIQAAIDIASAGDIIDVAAGTYNVTSSITVNKGVTIKGPATGSPAIVQGTNAAVVPVFSINSSNITIQNFEITHNALTAGLPSPWVEANNSLVVVPSGFTGLTGITITNNSIYVPTQTGAMSTWNGVALTVAGGTTAGITITNNIVHNTRNGIIIQYNNVVTISNNSIYDTKGGIMNYTNTQADADNRTMNNNTWGTTHNEWDIVWNTAYYVPDYSLSVLSLSNANNNAYVVDRRAANASACAALTGNRSHVFVNSTTGTITTGPTNGNFMLPYSTVNLAIAAVVPGGIINVASGTYANTTSLNINKALSLVGADEATVIIDGSGATSSANFIDITAPNVSIRNITIDGKIPHYTTWASIAKPYYGVNISSTTPNNISFQNVTVKAFGKNGINMNGATAISFNNVTSIDNGGAGFFMTDVNGISLQNITTGNNQWGGIGISTWGRYYAGGVSNVVFSGTNSFGENAGVQGGLYLEEGNYNDKANPYLITYSTNPSAGANITYLATNFGYTLNGPQDDGDPVTSDGYKRIRFYDTQGHIVTAAGAVYESSHLLSPGHLLDDGRYIIKLSDGSLFTPAGLDIQDAINAAPSGGTVNVANGTYPHIVINRPMTLNGNGSIITNASPAITINVSNVTVTGFTFVFNDNTIPYDDYAIDVQDNATNVEIHECNFQNMLNGDNGNGVINRGTGIVDATLNYWNSTTGPRISSNPAGTGRIATNSGGGILYYTPWYSDFSHTTPTLTTAVLLTPSNLSTGISILPTFSWDAVIGFEVTYQLEIATNISFAPSTIVYGPVTVTSPYQLPEAYALNNGTIYYWRLTAISGSITSSSIGKFTTIAPAIPIQANPANLSTIIGNIIYFTWYSGVAGVQYQLEVSQYSDFHTMISGIPTSASTSTYFNLAYNYSTLSAGEYYWRVKSYTSTGVLISISSTWSFIISGPPTTIPTYPVGGTTVYTSTPTIWWMSTNYSYASGIYYRVRYSTDHSYNLQTAPTTNLYATLSGLTVGQTYYYVIDASTSSTDWSAAATSLEESFTVFYSTVSNITVYQSYPTSGSIVYLNTPTFYWYIGMYIPGVTFDLEYFDGTWHTLGSISNYYYTLPFSLAGGTYSWRVRVHGGSTWFTETFTIYSSVSAETATIPIPITPIGGTVVATQSPSLTWYAYSASALDYQIIYSSDPTMAGGVLSNITLPNGNSSGWLTNSSYQLTGLTPGVTYYWQVRSRLASNPTIISSYSNIGQFTVSPGASPVVAIPANPIIGTNINSSVANLSWVIPAMSSSALSYDLELAKDPDMKSSIVINDLNQKNYKINNLDLNSTYYWRVKSKTTDGVSSNYSAVGSFTTGEVTAVEQENEIPMQFELKQNYPNPFNPTTKIFYSLPQNSQVTIKIYDMLGREVRTLINKVMNAGVHSVDWNADYENGNKVTSGIYMYRINAGNFVSTKKMIFIK